MSFQAEFEICKNLYIQVYLQGRNSENGQKSWLATKEGSDSKNDECLLKVNAVQKNPKIPVTILLGVQVIGKF